MTSRTKGTVPPSSIGAHGIARNSCQFAASAAQHWLQRARRVEARPVMLEEPAERSEHAPQHRELLGDPDDRVVARRLEQGARLRCQLRPDRATAPHRLRARPGAARRASPRRSAAACQAGRSAVRKPNAASNSATRAASPAKNATRSSAYCRRAARGSSRAQPKSRSTSVPSPLTSRVAGMRVGLEHTGFEHLPRVGLEHQAERLVESARRLPRRPRRGGRATRRGRA